MNRKFRLSVAALVALALVLVATGVWAAPKFQGTVPPPPASGTCNPTTNKVDMGTAEFADQTCEIKVEKVTPTDFAPAPEGLEFVGDTFKVTSDGTVTVCFAYPPAFADKQAKLYKLNETPDPDVWEEVAGQLIADGKICGTSTEGVFTLIGVK